MYIERKLTMLSIHRQCGLCPPGDRETVFLWVRCRDGRPLRSDAQSQLDAHRPPDGPFRWIVDWDPEHILWAEESH
jgi:hypothetical protein